MGAAAVGRHPSRADADGRLPPRRHWAAAFDLPGFDPGSIDVTLGVQRQSTRTVGRFHFEALLPGDVDEENVQASLEHGVLTVRRRPPLTQRPRRIPVTQKSR